ncbi:MAG: PIG-L family deacetylase [Bacteroidota bacterium]
MVRSLFFLFLSIPFISSGPSAQEKSNDALHQAFLDLSQDLVLMDLSAHPDDEDGASLALYRKRQGIKTYSVLFTRGEGGQNEKGPELYEALGVLRSQETERAGRILGAEVHFLNFSDFGYSKTASEAFRVWGGQSEALRRLVYVIRRYKPDVLFTNHNAIDGHGHHQAVAITAIAAFDAAADSNYSPEQLHEAGISLWQPRKLFFRSFGRWESVADVSNPVNDTDHVSGSTYFDIAVQALQMHRTQGMDRANFRAFTRGKSLYRLVRENSQYDRDSSTFFSGINLFHDPSVASLAPLRAALDRLKPGTGPEDMLPVASAVQHACDSLRSTGTLSVLGRRMVDHWEEELGRLVSAACGVRAEFIPRDSVAVPQQRVPCELTVRAGQCMLGAVQWSFKLPHAWGIQELPPEGASARPSSDRRMVTLTVSDDPELTLPKTVTNYRPINQHERSVARVSMTLNGRPFAVDVHPALETAPRQLIAVSPPSVGLLRSRLREGVEIEYTIKNFLPHKTAGRIGVRAPEAWSAENASFVIEKEDSVAHGRLAIRPPAGVVPGTYVVHVRTTLASAPVTINVIDAQFAPDVSLGIVKSYDTTLETAAATLGVRYEMISDADLAEGDLLRFSTIVVDIRAYLVRGALRAHNARLLDYVRRGGNLVVMYQRETEWKPEFAPYPFQITRRRVCVEDVPVTILAPGHPLLSKPNTIGESDWSGWKQERAVYMPRDVSAEYEKLIASADPDEPQLDTGYLAAHVGKGTYLYTSYVWYRQLKEGHAGAFRCFANMISYPSFREANR